MTPSDLISNPKNWCQGHSATDREGKPVSPLKSSCYAWDLYGACLKCDVDVKELVAAVKAQGFDGLASFNDKMTHVDVINILKRVGL